MRDPDLYLHPTSQPCTRPGCTVPVLTWFDPDYCSLGCLQHRNEPVEQATANPQAEYRAPARAATKNLTFVIDTGEAYEQRNDAWTPVDNPVIPDGYVVRQDNTEPPEPEPAAPRPRRWLRIPWSRR